METTTFTGINKVVYKVVIYLIYGGLELIL